jgi:formylglycine-generating enzyme required for sulfatase activity
MDIDTRLAYIQTIIGAVALIVSIIALVFAYIEISGSPTPTPPIIGESFSAVPTPLPTTQPPPDGVLTPSPTATLSVFEQVQTAEAIQTQQMQIQQTLNAQETATELTRINTEKTVEAIGATETVAFATLLALSATPTPTATLTALEQAIERARTFTGTRNVDWQPFSHVFPDGVEMVLVPVGCFQMGSNFGNIDERPVHEQCITEPFWLDKYEVTNALYGSASGCDYSSEADQPRNCVNWLDAQAFCEAHGGTLPSEKQWEYAARGLESWAYPWGNEYDVERVIGDDDPTYGDTQTAPVGSRLDGASWVEAMDMSGNVWEWTHTRHDPYPYEEGDNDFYSGDISNRVLRGGSLILPAFKLRSANRGDWHPIAVSNIIGFRCALSLNNSGL